MYKLNAIDGYSHIFVNSYKNNVRVLLLVSLMFVLISVIFFLFESMHLHLVICLHQWQSDDEQIYEHQVQRLVEMGFAEDDVRRALEENGHNEFMALLMLCVYNTNTKA